MNPPPSDAPGVVPLSEIELKLFVPSSSADRIWAQPTIVEHAIGPLRVARLDNRYFDTAGSDLARNGMALRLRRAGRNWVQTLKSGGSEDGPLSERGEWEMAVPTAALRLANLRDTPLAALGPLRTLARRLAPVFTSNFRRESRLLRLADDSEIEVAYDVGVIGVGRGRTKRTLPIRELELELKRSGRDDPADALLRFAARLARDLPVIPLDESKAARGHRLAAGRALRPAKVELPDGSPDTPASVHLGLVLDACQRALLANVHALLELRSVPARTDARQTSALTAANELHVAMDEAAAAYEGKDDGKYDGKDDDTAATADDAATVEDQAARRASLPSSIAIADRAAAHAVIDPAIDAGLEFVHQARVAIRRMRSALRIFRPVAGGRRFGGLDDALRGIGHVFGAARDLDVLATSTIDRIGDKVASDEAGRAALDTMRWLATEQRAEAHAALIRAIDTGTFGASILDAMRLVRRVANRKKSGPLFAELAPRRLSDQRERVVERARRLAVLDADERHRLRIDVKRLRYALDLCDGLYDGAASASFVEALAALQGRLGRLNDEVVARRLLQSFPASAARDLVVERLADWLERHLRRQLPKVGALSIAFELEPLPWSSRGTRTLG